MDDDNDIRPGSSPNPGGRPRNTPEMKEAKALAKQKTRRAVERLAEIMEHSEDDKAVIAAANSILDRAFGKPVQAVTADVEVKGEIAMNGDAVRLELARALSQLAGRLAPPPIESTAEAAPALPGKDPGASR